MTHCDIIETKLALDQNDVVGIGTGENPGHRLTIYGSLVDSTYGFSTKTEKYDSDVESQLSDITIPDGAPNSKEDNLPLQSSPRLYRYLRWNFLSVYRRLFSIVFLANFGAFLGILFGPGCTFSNTLTAVSFNLLASTIVRHDNFVNLLFLVSCSLPLSAPLLLRRWVAKIYSYGGLHSGCSISAVAWYLAFTVLVTLDLAQEPEIHPILAVIAAITYIILILFLAIIVLAHPKLRARFHNHFEATHKFAGWTIVLLFWALTILFTHFNKGMRTLGLALLNTPSFWCLIFITLCIIYPWAHLRKRTVRAEPLSNHAIRLHFSHATPTYCSTIRISNNPLRETHAFACIPSVCAPCGTQTPNSFSVIVSNAGDWTGRIIANPPTSLYTKGTPTLGVLRVAIMFKRPVIVATGSGIAPCLSLFAGCPDLGCRVIWSTQTPLSTFNQDVINAVLRADPQAVIVDTQKEGRPDLVRLAYRVYEESGAEAVFVISNAAVTRKVVYGLESRGVPAFAPIFDS